MALKGTLLENSTSKEESIFNQINTAFREEKNFDSFLKKKFQFNDRRWTYGQFLYKYFYDKVQDFSYRAKEHFKDLSGRDKELALKFKFMLDNKMIKPDAVLQTEKIKELNMFGGNKEKEKFYTDLFTGNYFSKKGWGYWHPGAQYQFSVIEHMLTSQMGMTEDQVKSLMIHCEKKREDATEYYSSHKPKEFIHNSPRSPADMKKITPHMRYVDTWIDTNEYCFVTDGGTFHSGLPIQKENMFISWPRFNPKAVAFEMSVADFEKKATNSYNYTIHDTKSFRPAIPLWGGPPHEWTSEKTLSYKQEEVEVETLNDLMKKGMKFYLIPDKNVWKNEMSQAEKLSPKEAIALLDGLCKEGKAVLYSKPDVLTLAKEKAKGRR